MRVIVADDQPEVCSALKLLLEEKPNVKVIFEAKTSYELLWRVKSECPDLVLLDWELPGTKPKDLISVLQSICPNLSIIVLSSTPQTRKIALEAGATGFVCKSEPPEQLLTALENFGATLS
jgi:DNA-binding NarL/FixJ family response regulator